MSMAANTKARTHLRMVPHIEDERGTTYRLETQHGHEVGYVMSWPAGWTVWSERGYFQGQGAKDRMTLTGMVHFLTAVCQMPICIYGGINDDSKDSQRDFTPTAA